MRMVTASILGASGYTGGELLRLLRQHPDDEVRSATSQRFAGQYRHRAHPNLRGATELTLVARDALEPAAQKMNDSRPRSTAVTSPGDGQPTTSYSLWTKPLG